MRCTFVSRWCAKLGTPSTCLDRGGRHLAPARRSSPFPALPARTDTWDRISLPGSGAGEFGDGVYGAVCCNFAGTNASLVTAFSTPPAHQRALPPVSPTVGAPAWLSRSDQPAPTAAAL